MIAWFDPQPRADELPPRLPSPFATEPHAIARRAVRELVARLPQGPAGRALELGGEGKMFGVLVVVAPAPDGRIGYLRAFSGMLGGTWHVDGFAPPVFDEAARDAFWPAGEAELGVLDARRRVLETSPARAELAELVARHVRESAELRDRHHARRAARHVTRDRFAHAASIELDAPDGRANAAELHALDQESRGDGAERKRLEAAHRAELAPVAARARVVDDAIAELERARTARSRELLRAIHDTYVIANARGERATLRELFVESPPGGAGDCAAPKLFAYAYRQALRPIALAEVWIGAPPATGGRIEGACYPACRGKCGPILAHVLQGLDAEPSPIFGDADAIAPDEPRVVFEDTWLAVVAKPIGLLSVPGRSGLLRDSVATRLAARFGAAHVVHRLDLDTSGLLLVAKDPATHAALQRLFARREIDKRYVAQLDGVVAGDRGVIELPLRVDLDDRPRQIVDPIHGKSAVTEWRVVSRTAGTTRVELVPRTGRTHQLRVHAAHPLGLGAPVTGDRLYGRASTRMLLHAEALAFAHPHTGNRIELELPAPF